MRFSGHIKIKSTENITGFAMQLKQLLNVADQNKSIHIKQQERDGLNRGGGLYYLFEVLGLQIYLIENAGEVQFFEPEWKFYITVEFDDDIEKEIYDGVLNYINFWLSGEGFLTDIER